MHTSVRRRLRLGLLAMALLVALGCAAAVLALRQLGGAIDRILRENYASVRLVDQMTAALARQDSAALFAASGHQDLARPMLATHRQRFAAAYAREQHNITLREEGPLVDEIGARYRDYVAHVDRVLAAPSAQRTEAYFRELLPRFTDLENRLDRVRQMNQQSMERADRDARALARRTVNAALAISLTAVLFAIWFAWWQPRAIVRPLKALTASAHAVGEGDLTATVPAPAVEELAPLAQAFNQMLAQLRAYRASSLGELLAAKDLARATVECMLDPVVVFGRDGTVLLANSAAQSAFGLRTGSPEELRSAEIVVPERLAAARDLVFSSGAPVLPQSLSEALRWQGQDGEKSYVVRAAPLQPGPSGAPGAIVVAQEVTRFRRIDELKSDMVATVSHQFKTPLTSLRLATHLLLEPSTGPLTEAQHALLTTVHEDTERLRTMVDELLDLVRIEAEAGALHRVPVEPSALLSEVADAHRTIAQHKGVALEIEPTAQPGPVSIDPERLSIVLANLVANAIQYTPAGGKVTLAAHREDGALHLTVTDTGAGIDPKDLARIFDRTASDSGAEVRARRGLGLTIARELVLQHGGELSARSWPGRGSIFSVVLPLSPLP